MTGSFHTVCCILLIGMGVVHAQEYAFTNYNNLNGLPSSEVYEIHQDASGFLWFGTDDGVARFDGKDFRIFNTTHGLTNQVVFGFYEDHRARLWFRTFSPTVCFYENNRIYPYPFNDRIRSVSQQSIIADIAVDHRNSLHFTTYMGGVSAAIDTLGNIASRAEEPHTLFVNQVTDNDYLIGYTGATVDIRYVAIDHKKFPVSLRDSVQNNIVKCHIVWDKKHYIAVDRNLFEYDGTTLRQVLTASLPIISLSLDKRGHLWVGYFNGGVERFSEHRFNSSETIPVLGKRSVSSVLEDHEGGFWFATLKEGVFYFPNLDISHYPLEKPVDCLTLQGDRLYAGNQKGELMCIDTRTKKTIWSSDLRAPVLSVHSLPDKSIFVSTVSYTATVDASGSRRSVDPSIISIKNFYSRNDTIWGVDQWHVYRFFPSGKLMDRHPIDFWGRIVVATDDAVYVAGVTGLVKFDKTLRQKTKIASLSDSKISAIVPINDRQLFVATHGHGFHMLNDTTRVSFTWNDDAGYTGNSVFSAILANGFIWMGTEAGILKINAARLATGSLEYEKLDKFSGLPVNKNNLLTAVRDSVWSFSESGFSVIPQQLKTFSGRHPLFYWKSRKVNNKEVAALSGARLSFDHNNITSQFGYIAFNNPVILTRYRLAGQAGGWTTTLDRSITLYALSPGDYKLQLQYAVDPVTWTALPPEAFSILKPWWETWAFRAAITLIIILIIYYFIRNRYEKFKQSKLREIEIQTTLRQEKDRIAQDLHDNIGTQLTLLSKGLDRLNKNNTPSSTEISRLQENITSTIHELRDTIWALNKQQVSLEELHHKINNLLWQYRQSNPEILYALHTPEPMPDKTLKPLEAIHLFRIVQEALNNCIKHSHANTVDVTLTLLRDNALTVSVQDNGIGLTREGSSENQYGLLNMERRAAEIDATFNIESEKNRYTKVSVTLS